MILLSFALNVILASCPCEKPTTGNVQEEASVLAECPCKKKPGSGVQEEQSLMASCPRKKKLGMQDV